MILGYALLALALAATVGACVCFTLSRREGRAALLSLARRMVVLGAVSVVAASGYLVYLIATHQFQVAYVAEYSAKRSASKYLFAAFWGGQEGSILLWAFWTAILGTVLAFRAGGRENRVWPIFGTVQMFLLVLVLVKCPFRLGEGPVPADGRGLNPLLENPWMVIHPPILFLGFSSLAVPFAWALYGVLHRDWDGWVKRVFPWALFSFAVHGFGVSLGGYWAYETLGWGGFWAWDPVENSSLVPWLFLIGLLHGIAIQRANGGFKVTNLFLGFLPLAWMTYGTFLTRTGLLTDFSVHSFSSLGADGYWLLLGGVLTAFLLPAFLILKNFRAIPRPTAYERVLSREWGFFLAAALLGLLGLITAAGMSAPIITKLWEPKGAAAQPEFYNKATFPLAILMAVAMAATPYFAWRATDADSVLRRLFPAYAVSIAATLGLFLLGARHPWMLLLFATSVFAVLTNALLVLPRLRRREARRTVGGFVAHMGAGLVLVGVACLVAFSREQRVSLIMNQPTEALGYKLTYLGMTSQPFDRDNGLRIRVEKNGRSWETAPRLFLAPWGGKDTPFANPPAILPNIWEWKSLAALLPWNNPFPWGDLYIAHFKGPISNDAKHPNAGMTLGNQEERTWGDYKFKFWGADFDEEVRHAMQTGGMKAVNKLPEIRVRAMVDVTYKGQKTSLAPAVRMEQMGAYSRPVPLPGAPGATLVLDTPGEHNPQFPRRVVLYTTGLPDPSEVLLIDISTKPMIGLVWLGTILYTLGGIVAYRRRAVEADAKDEAEAETPAPVPDGAGRRRDRRNVPGRRAPEPARATATPPPSRNR